MISEPLKLRTKAGFFFSFTFGWSLVFWLLTVGLGGIDQFPGTILQYIVGAGPLVAALILTFLKRQLFRGISGAALSIHGGCRGTGQ